MENKQWITIFEEKAIILIAILLFFSDYFGKFESFINVITGVIIIIYSIVVFYRKNFWFKRVKVSSLAAQFIALFWFLGGIYILYLEIFSTGF